LHINVEQLDDHNPGLLRSCKVHHDYNHGLEKVIFDNGISVLSNYEDGKAFQMNPSGQCHEYILNKDEKRHALFRMQWRDGMTLRSDGYAANAWLTLTDGDLPVSYTAYDKINEHEFAHVRFSNFQLDVDSSVFVQPSGCKSTMLEIDRETIIYQPYEFEGSLTV
jgi:hypothetical protein